MKLPAASEVIEFHDYVLAAPGQPARFKEGKGEENVWAAIEANHWHNRSLWEQEDLARRRDVPDSEIASNKRASVAYNKTRNNALENCDGALMLRRENAPAYQKARQHSETAGAM